LLYNDPLLCGFNVDIKGLNDAVTNGPVLRRTLTAVTGKHRRRLTVQSTALSSTIDVDDDERRYSVAALRFTLRADKPRRPLTSLQPGTGDGCTKLTDEKLPGCRARGIRTFVSCQGWFLKPT